jgi:aryl-alcohol dehydrogenase-like predicted oxidoreductase
MTSAMTNTIFAVGGDIEVRRLGFGAMRITGPGVWGPPRDRAAARALLRRVDRRTRHATKRRKDPAHRRLQRHSRTARRRPDHHRRRNRAEPAQPHRRQLAHHAHRMRAARDRIHPLPPPPRLGRPDTSALAWLLAVSPVTLPIPGTATAAHLDANLAAAALQLDQAEMHAITAAASRATQVSRPLPSSGRACASAAARPATTRPRPAGERR